MPNCHNFVAWGGTLLEIRKHLGSKAVLGVS